MKYAKKEGIHPSALPGFNCIKISRGNEPTRTNWQAGVSLIVQGRKDIVLGDETYRFGPGSIVTSPIDLPVVSCVRGASAEKPFLAIKLRLDPAALAEVAAGIGEWPPAVEASTTHAIFGGAASEDFVAAATRLTALLGRIENAKVLAPLIERELYFHLLRGSNGAAIRKFVLAGTSAHRIWQAVYRLRANLAEELDVGKMARAAGMSRSTFFRSFKELTAASPIQYQKRLRLLEARRLMTDEAATAEGAAYQVGYNSPSQFSRDYARMFGDAPRRDAQRLRARRGLLISSNYRS